MYSGIVQPKLYSGLQEKGFWIVDALVADGIILALRRIIIKMIMILLSSETNIIVYGTIGLIFATKRIDFKPSRRPLETITETITFPICDSQYS